MLIPLNFKKLFKIRKGKVEKLKKEEESRIEGFFLDTLFTLQQTLVQIAKKQINQDDIIIRDLRPQDLSGKIEYYRDTKPSFEFKVKKGWNELISQDNYIDHRFMGISGFTIPKDCNINQITIEVEGGIKRYFTLEGLDGTYFITDPIIIGENMTFKIHGYSKSDKKQILVFHGLVTERSGMTIGKFLYYKA